MKNRMVVAKGKYKRGRSSCDYKGLARGSLVMMV